jgi:hypothetical protein
MATGSLEYDIDAFVKKQKAIGRPDEEIKSFLEKNFNPQVAQLHFGRNVEGTTEKPELSALQQVPVEAVALAGAGAGKSIYSGFKSLSDKMAEPKVETPKIEPLMDVNQKPSAGRIEPEFNKPGSSVVQITKDPIEQKLFEIYQAQQAAKTQPPPMMGQPGFQPSAPAAPVAPITAPVAPPVAQAPSAMPAVPPKEAPPPAAETKKTGGRPTKQAVAAEMEGKEFKAGFGGADNYIEKQFGPDIRRFMKDEFNQGKPYGGGQAAMDKAYADIPKYNQWLKENIPEQTLNRDERKAMGIPPNKEYPVLGKAMKVGGVAGLLMTAGQAANAKEAFSNIAESLLPWGITPSEVATGKLTEKQLEAYKEAQKLGSPYRSVPPR